MKPNKLWFKQEILVSIHLVELTQIKAKIDFCLGNHVSYHSFLLEKLRKEKKKKERDKRQQQNKNNFISLVEVEAFNYWGKLRADL